MRARANSAAQFGAQFSATTARRPRARPPLAGASACVPLATTLGAKFSGDLVVALSAPPPSAAAPPLHTHVRLSWRVAPAKGTRSAAAHKARSAAEKAQQGRRRSLGGLLPDRLLDLVGFGALVLLAARALSFDVPSDLSQIDLASLLLPANSTSGLDSLLPPLSPPLLLLLLPLVLLAVAWYVIGFKETAPAWLITIEPATAPTPATPTSPTLTTTTSTIAAAARAANAAGAAAQLAGAAAADGADHPDDDESNALHMDAMLAAAATSEHSLLHDAAAALDAALPAGAGAGRAASPAAVAVGVEPQRRRRHRRSRPRGRARGV